MATLDLADSDDCVTKMKKCSQLMLELADAYLRRATDPNTMLEQSDAIATEWTVHYDAAMAAGGLYDYSADQ